MTPKKSNQFIKPTADKLNISESLVEKVVDFYWASLRKALVNIDEPALLIPNFGTFKIKNSALKKHITRYENYLKNLDIDNLTFKKHAIYTNAKNNLDNLYKLQEILEQEKIRKELKSIQKLDYEFNRGLEK